MKLIGIDLGTSFIKGALLDLDTCRLLHVQRFPFPEPLPHLPPGFREFDPAAIMDAVYRLLDMLAPFAADTDCQGIVWCSQMHGAIFCTSHGDPRSNFITWQDQRTLQVHPSGGTYFDVVRSRLESAAPDLIRQLGNELRPGLPIALFYWLAAQRQLPPDSIATPLPAFVIANLCGASPVTEITNAHAHGLLNMDASDWHREALAALDLTDLSLPAIVPANAVVGHLTLAGRQLPCYAPVGDYQAALAGALLAEGELSLNISTGSQVSLLTPGPRFGNFQTRPYFDGRCTAVITHLPAGRALNALVGLLSELAIAQGISLPDPWPYITEQAANVSAPDMQVGLTFYSTPLGERGHISNIRESELTVGHVFRAAFESMADNYHQCALRISPGQDWQRLVFSGGLAQKIPLLRDLIARNFQADYRLSPHVEDTLLGLLVLGMAFTHRAESVAEASAMVVVRYG